MRSNPLRRFVAAAATLPLFTAPAAVAIDAEHHAKARESIERAIAYLRSQQDEATGGWAVSRPGPKLPAITGLVVNGLVMEPGVDATDPAVARGVDFMLSFRQPDGAIADGILPSYNTAICLSALARIDGPEADAAIGPAQDFLRGVQWSEETVDTADSPGAPTIDRAPPFYGGVGYGGHGRPDNSNLHLMLQGLRDSGVSCDDAAFQRALVFLARTQMHEAVNDMPYAEGSRQGGFIYATSPDKDSPGAGESKAGLIEEPLPDGSTRSRLRAYGSMTYAGFKCYIFAELERDDPRVRLAYDWIRQNYTVEENPGVGMQGLYYYYATMARALDAWGEDTIETINADGSVGPTRDWANDLIDQLASLQKEDGSFENVHDRWMEGDPVLVTAFALLALQHAVN